MFIELTDHLRCPADHDESFLVLIPGTMRGREVSQGVLGCPVCRREYPIVDAVVRFSAEPPGATVAAPGALDADAVAAFLGLEGPGGYVGLIGGVGRLGPKLAGHWPGIHLVALNPPSGVETGEHLSVLWSTGLPFKARALRGCVIGAPYASDRRWAAGAVASVLPGLRAVGQGPAPDLPGFEIMAEADGWWVGRTGR